MNKLMKKFTLLIILLSLGIASYAQVNQVDKQGRKQGKWEKLYPNEKPRYTGQFKNNIEVGIFKFYNIKGQLKAEKSYRGTSGVCYAKIYGDNGKLNAEGVYIGTKKDSVWKYYNNKEQLILTESYDKGIKHGEFVTYYENGVVAERISYKNGIKHGEWVLKFEDGLNKTKANYVDGMLHGDAVYYSVLGKPLMKGKYEEDLKVGTWMIFDEETGRPLKYQTYEEGIMIKEKDI